MSKRMQAGNWSQLALLFLPACPLSVAPSSWGLFCFAHLKTQSLPTPVCSLLTWRWGAMNWNSRSLFRILYIGNTCCLQNNFWSFLPSIETNFNLEILFPGRCIRTVFLRTEDQLSPIPQPAVKYRGPRKCCQTVSCLSLQEQWQNKLLFVWFCFPYTKPPGPDPRLLAF